MAYAACRRRVECGKTWKTDKPSKFTLHVRGQRTRSTIRFVQFASREKRLMKSEICLEMKSGVHFPGNVSLSAHQSPPPFNPLSLFPGSKPLAIKAGGVGWTQMTSSVGAADRRKSCRGLTSGSGPRCNK